ILGGKQYEHGYRDVLSEQLHARAGCTARSGRILRSVERRHVESVDGSATPPAAEPIRTAAQRRARRGRPTPPLGLRCLPWCFGRVYAETRARAASMVTDSP